MFSHVGESCVRLYMFMFWTSGWGILACLAVVQSFLSSCFGTLVFLLADPFSSCEVPLMHSVLTVADVSVLVNRLKSVIPQKKNTVKLQVGTSETLSVN